MAGLDLNTTTTADAPRSTPNDQLRLDSLLTRVAVEMMSISADSLVVSLESVLRMMNDYFEVDTSFLRRNDRTRDVTVLVAEWPKREGVPDPDPIGEVPLGSDPVFDATWDLKEPLVIRPSAAVDAYQERIEQASGISGVSVGMVPLISGQVTVGVLGFVKFGDRSWDPAETNALQGVASLMVHLQARVEAEDRLRYEAYHDDLTGLPNRRSVLEVLDRRLADRPGESLAVLLIDLDRFKGLNDFLGHEAGDGFLRVVAGRLQGRIGAGDFVARLVGDEFVVLLGSGVVEDEATSLANSLLDLVSGPVAILGHQISRTASLGLAFGRCGETTADELLAQADAALSLSKAHGGDRSVVFDKALREAVTRRAEMELQLRQAVLGGGLLLYYQPEVDLRTGELLAVEALVRWNHPERGVVAAGEFIAIAEETGLIAELGAWVLTEACAQMAKWRRELPSLRMTMRVNMSAAQLEVPNIVDVVRESLSENDLPGEVLCLEITEHAVVREIEQAIRVLNDLKSLGVTLAIDDFGTGYSSMTQLKRLPVDTLKVDQTFVAGLGINPRDRAIVDATIRLAGSFGLGVVAEGVETPGMVAELLDLGCVRAQGYLLCRPRSAADLAPILLNGGIDPPLTTASVHRSGPPAGSGRGPVKLAS